MIQLLLTAWNWIGGGLSIFKGGGSLKVILLVICLLGLGYGYYSYSSRIESFETQILELQKHNGELQLEGGKLQKTIEELQLANTENKKVIERMQLEDQLNDAARDKIKKEQEQLQAKYKRLLGASKDKADLPISPRLYEILKGLQDE